MDEKGNLAVVQSAYAAFGRGDLPGLLELVAAEVAVGSTQTAKVDPPTSRRAVFEDDVWVTAADFIPDPPHPSDVVVLKVSPPVCHLVGVPIRRGIDVVVIEDPLDPVVRDQAVVGGDRPVLSRREPEVE